MSEVKPSRVGTIGGRAIVGRDQQSLSHQRLSHQRSSHCGYNVNKKKGRFGGRKNDRLISKKPPNPVGTEEENQDRKDLIIVQSPRINLCGQWYIELFYSQSTSRPVICKVMTLHLQSTLRPGLHLGDLIRLRPVKPSLPATTFLPHGEFS